jgi:glucose dehydrogenase
MWIALAFMLTIAIAAAGCGEKLSESPVEATASPANVDESRMASAGSDPDNWMSHGRTYAEERFSPLSQINDGNVQKLDLAWYFESDPSVGTEATPPAVRRLHRYHLPSNS